MISCCVPRRCLIKSRHAPWMKRGGYWISESSMSFFSCTSWRNKGKMVSYETILGWQWWIRIVLQLSLIATDILLRGCNRKRWCITAGLLSFMYLKGDTERLQGVHHFSQDWIVWKQSSTTVDYIVGPWRKCCEGAVRGLLGNRVGNLA